MLLILYLTPTPLLTKEREMKGEVIFI